MGLFRRKPIPAPLNPQLPPVEHRQELAIPYSICDAPRQFLAWLANYTDLPEKHREVIAQWVLGYGQELLHWIWSTHGFHAVLEADEISKAIARQFHQKVNDEYKTYEADLLSKLEEEMRDDN